jgi:hypothetical protein
LALTVPDTDELLLAMRRTTPFTAQESEWAEDALQRATDLARIATGLTEDPVGPDDDPDFPQRILTQGILAMAYAIEVRSDDADEFYSPFTSERLGSYSYSKAMQAVREGSATGVPWFDEMVAYFAAADASSFAMATEYVFAQPYSVYVAQNTTFLDPSLTFEHLFGE